MLSRPRAPCPAAARARAVVLSLVLSLVLASAPAPAQAQTPLGNRRFDDYGVAILGALNKITGNYNLLRVPVGFSVTFDTLRIGVRTCRKTPPEELPEVVIYLEIDERRPGDQVGETRWARQFHGFMFASSPAVAAMEHPVYDVWSVDCQELRGPAPTPTPRPLR